MEILGFHDERTATISYLIGDPTERICAIIDPVLDFEPRAVRTHSESADRIIAAVTERAWRVDWILETHCHADHLSAAQYLKRRLGGQVAIGSRIPLVQATWKGIYHLDPSFPVDGSQFDRLLNDGDRVMIGGLDLRVWQTPGHTPACVSYVTEGAAFVGDTLFMPDYGTARADFPGGDARELYRSIRRLLALPPSTRLFVCHDYAPGGRPVAWEATVAEHRAGNPHVKDGVDEASYVAMRTARDKQLNTPDLLLPAIQVNIAAGRLPPPEANGTSYLKLPLNRF